MESLKSFDIRFFFIHAKNRRLEIETTTPRRDRANFRPPLACEEQRQTRRFGGQGIIEHLEVSSRCRSKGTGNIEEVVLASCTPLLERSAFPPLFSPLSFLILYTNSTRFLRFTGLFSSTRIVIEEGGFLEKSTRNRWGMEKIGEVSMGREASVGSSAVTSQQFDLTGASWSTPLTPSNHFLAAR